MALMQHWFITGIIMLVPASYVGSCTIRDDRLAAHFEHVTIGMQRSEVIHVLGTPRYTQDCASPGPFKPQQRPDYAEAYVYPSWGQPLLPAVWVVWFNAKGVAIDKYNFVSW